MNVERFLIQVKQNLPEHEGVTTWVENSALNVGYGKTESFEIRYPGGICYNAATEKTYFTDYEKAKEDFAMRSGLLQSTKLFKDKEMIQI